jgi:ABC-type sugar transport system substrate-binding protein
MKTSAMPARSRACGVAALLATALAAPSAFAQDRAELLGKLPSEVQSLYTDVIEVGPSSYDNYSPPQKPWQWCHSESYMGNPWRVTMNDELKRLVEAAKAEGLIPRISGVGFQWRPDPANLADPVFYRARLLYHHDDRRFLDRTQSGDR